MHKPHGNNSLEKDRSMNQPTKKTWIIAALILVGVGVAFTVYKKKAADIPLYRETKVVRGNLENFVLSTGTVSPENRLDIKPPVAGRVETVLAKEGSRVTKGQVLAWMSSTERAALIDAARSKGEEELKHWEELYRPTPILAPINGTLIQRNVEAGQTFSNVDSVFVMSDRLTVKAQVDETDIAQIKIGQKATLTLDAYPALTIAAHVDQIAFDAKTVNNVTTYIVDVLPDNTPATMRSGMTANVRFVLASKNDILLIPTEAIKTKNNKSIVLVKNPVAGGQPEDREIETGLSDGKQTEVTNGLTEQNSVMIAEGRPSGSKPSSAGSNPFMPMGNTRRAGSGGGK